MSEAAVIRHVDQNMGVYILFCGNIDYVEMFLEYCKLKGYPTFVDYDGYGVARFCQVVGNYFGGTHSLGVVEDTAQVWTDFGEYIIKDWDYIGGAWYEDERGSFNRNKILLDIDRAQPKDERLGRDFILNTESVKLSDLKFGDKLLVFVSDTTGYRPYTVAGFGGEELVAQESVLGIPYINDRAFGSSDYSLFRDNYLDKRVFRRIKTGSKFDKGGD